MKIKLLIVFLVVPFLLVSADVFGQGFCGTTGGFIIEPSEGCAPLKVTVKNQVVKSDNVRYDYNFDKQKTTFPENKDTSADSVYVYNKAGTYTIFQFGSANGTGFSLCKDVVVYETRAPKADLTFCQNGRVRLTLARDSVSKAYDEIEINWGDGQSVTLWKEGMPLVIDHQYPSDNSHPAITIRGKYAAGLCQSSLNTTTLSASTLPPSLSQIRINSVEISADGKAKILYGGMEGVSTKLFMDSGDGQFVATGKEGAVGGTQSLTVDNLNVAQAYRFKLISKDLCDNPVESLIVNSVIISEGTFSLDEINSVAWKNYAGTGNLLQYQLLRDGKVIFTTINQLSYLDSDVKCGNKYKYQVVAIIENDVRSYSAEIIIEPKTSSPEVINRAYVSVGDDNTIFSAVELSGVGLTSNYDLIVERADLGSSDFKIISDPKNESLRFEDKNVNTSENSYCYRFSYKNACNLSSPSFSQPVCSILMKNNVQNVSWTSESPFIAGMESYDIQQIDENGNVTDEVPKQLSLHHNLDLQTQSAFSFRIKAHSADGNLSFSNIVSIKRDIILLIPDIFTPNGDGINDSFEVKSYFLSSFKMLIYNRWGEVVFQSEDAANGWDGNINGKPAPAGYYVFKIEALDRLEHQLMKSGSLLMVR